MSKRGFQKFPRPPRDAVDTPPEAVAPLRRYIPARYVEPCAAPGALIRALDGLGWECDYACDIAPRAPRIGDPERGGVVQDYIIGAAAA